MIRMPSWNKTAGFTLIELLITLVILAIVLGYAMPKFRTLLDNGRTVALSEEFSSAINFARIEAIKRGKPVSLCKSTNASSCDAAGNDWNVGYLVYVEGQASEVATTTSIASSGLLKVYPPTVASKSSIDVKRGVANVQFLRFTSLGALAKNINSEAVITTKLTNCDGVQREITLKLSGSMSVVKKPCS